MKNPIEIIKSLPKELLEVLSFFSAVLIGTIYKVLKQNEGGVKITFKKLITEAFMSFFIAMIVFAVFDQFLDFSQLFTYVMCSLAGSMSSVFHSRIEDLIGFLFDWIKRQFNKAAIK